MKYPDVQINNLTSSFEDGKGFLALLNDADPNEAPYRPTSDNLLNRKKAYRLAEDLFGVPQLLNYQDERVFSYEQVMYDEWKAFVCPSKPRLLSFIYAALLFFLLG